MRNLRFSLALLVMLAAPLALDAAEIVSPSLPATSAQEWVECRIVNLSTSAQEVVVQAFDSTGSMVMNTLDLVQPGAVGGVSINGQTAANYCKFTVKGSKDNFRASINVLDATTPTPTIKVALPAY